MPAKQREEHTAERSAPAGQSEMTDDAAMLKAFGFNAMPNVGFAWVEALSEMGSEVLTFVADRIREDVKTQHKLLHCRDVGEMQEIQSEFVRKAIEHYSAESGKLVEMSRAMMDTSNKNARSN